MNKIEARKKYLDLRKKLDNVQIISKSISISNNLQDLPIWEHNFYHIYLPIKEKNEVDTMPIINILNNKKKKVLIPKSDFNNTTMKSFLLNDNTVKIDLDVAESLKNLRKGKKRKANSTNNSVNNNVGNVAIANNNSSNGSNNGKNDKPRYATPRCPGVNTKKMIHKDEAKGLCHNCDVDQISKNYPYLMKDFS